MSSQATQPVQVPKSSAVAGAKDSHRWQDAWQLPTLALGGIALAAGLVYSVKTAPRVDRGAGLAEASAQMEEGKYAEALGTLNSKVLPHLAGDGLTVEQQREFFLLRARSIYLGQHDLGINRKENNEHILSEYREAVQHGAQLTSKDHAYRAFTLIESGEMDRASEEMGEIASDDSGAADLRLAINKRMIENAMSRPAPKFDVALEMIARLAERTDLPDSERFWLLTRQARMLVAQGFAEEAISRILRAMPRLEGADPRLTGEIMVVLAEAYMAVDSVGKAGQQLTKAAALLGEGHELAPRVARLLGLVDQTAGGERVSGARDRYTRVLEAWPFSPEAPEALLGLAEVESIISNAEAPQMMQESIKHYGNLVETITGESLRAVSQPAKEVKKLGAPGDGVAAPKVDAKVQGNPKSPADGTPPNESPGTESDNQEKPFRLTGVVPGTLSDRASLVSRTLRSIMSRFVEQFDKREYESALRLAELAHRITGPDNAPSELLLRTARTHEELADQLLGKGRADTTALTLAKVDPATQRDAREHLIKAGEYFRMHAGKVVQTDAKGYGDSLWAAADMFDRAGDLAGSASAFLQFATDFPADSRKPQALFRLAEACRARGDLEQATKIYRGLIAGRNESRDGGPVADASYVPLAKTLLLDDKPENDAEAEALLGTVVRGEIGGSATPIFREALRSLGEYYYDAGRYEEAIERLNEFLERTSLDAAKANAQSAAGSGELAGADSPEGVGESVGSLSANTPAVVPAPGKGAAGDKAANGETLGLRYKLADAYRLSASNIAKSFAAAMPDSQRRELEKERRDRLEQSVGLFDDVQRGYDRLPRRAAIDELRLRNAYFYQADCAFDLKDFPTAIRLYDSAKERYPKDAASLVAMVQIVAALLEQGKTQEAATANARAKRFYESLPDSAWDDPTLPMTRKQWEDWLDSQTRLAGAEGDPK